MSTDGHRSRSDVLVIGAGVIGLATAYELGRRGARVTVLDRGEPGMGCSYGNAGWISPSSSFPLPMPGMLGTALTWLGDPESPLYIQPRASLRLASWLARFVRSMNHAHLSRALPALLEISRYGLARLAELESETGHPTGFRRDGLLVAAQSDEGLAAAFRNLERVAAYGVKGRRLDETDIREFEPALCGATRGGVFYPDEAHAEPFEVVRAYAKGIERQGGAVLARHEVFAFRTGPAGVRAVETTGGTFSAERYVLAAGAWSPRLAARLGLDIPVMGGKGYAVILPPVEPMPRRPMLIAERKIAVTPREGSLRLAGTLELVDGDETITPRRVAAMVKGARLSLPVPEPATITDVWRGLRPCTPDGLPVIGFAPRLPNLLISTGHQMLGLKTAPASGRLAADLATGTPPAFDPAPFRVERF